MYELLSDINEAKNPRNLCKGSGRNARTGETSCPYCTQNFKLTASGNYPTHKKHNALNTS